jgi:hypothetical protein
MRRLLVLSGGRLTVERNALSRQDPGDELCALIAGFILDNLVHWGMV